MSRKGATGGSGLKSDSIEVRRRIPRAARNRLRAGAVSVEELVSSAQSALDNLEFESARMLVNQALKLDRDNATALELRALLYLEDGNPVEARKLFRRAVDIQPETGFSKYMYLGQIETGQEAAQHYTEGIRLMAEEAEELHDEGRIEELADLNQQISVGFCSLAELYLTDLCDAENAEETCRILLEKALQYDESNVQALQSFGSYFISMEDNATALDYVRRSVAIWFRPKEPEIEPEQLEQLQQEADATTSEDPNAGMNVDDDEYEDVDEDEEEVEPPPYEFRISTAKLLIELADYALADQILNQLVEEDEEVMQVWYLLGWSAFLQQNSEQAEESLTTARELFHTNECEEQEVLQHIDELLASVRATAESTEPQQSTTEDVE